MTTYPPQGRIGQTSPKTAYPPQGGAARDFLYILYNFDEPSGTSWAPDENGQVANAVLNTPQGGTPEVNATGNKAGTGPCIDCVNGQADGIITGGHVGAELFAGTQLRDLEFTIAVWYLYQNVNTSIFLPFSLWNETGTGGVTGWRINTFNRAIFFEAFDSGSNIVSINATTVGLAATWYHAAFVGDGAGNIEAFLNGSTAGTDTISAGNIIQGTERWGCGQPFNRGGGINGGRVDQALIATRALDSSEISDLYNGGTVLDTAGVLAVVNG